LIKITNQNLIDQNKKLQQEMKARMTEMDNMKLQNQKSMERLLLRKSEKSLVIQSPDTTQEKIDTGQSVDTKPSLSWSTLVNIVKARNRKIPADPQPLELKEEPYSPRTYVASESGLSRQPHKRKKSRTRKSSKERIESEYQYDSEEEYLLIEEEEESEDESPDSGVFSHF